MSFAKTNPESSRPPTIAAGAAFHERLARTWSLGYARGGFRRRLEFVTARLHGRLRGGQTWLDAGCGSGVLSRELAARGANVIALDGSPAMLEQARGVMNVASQSIRYELIESVEQLPLPNASVDGLLCSSVLEYVDAPDVALTEFHRVLRPGGILLLTVPNRRSVIRAVQGAARALACLGGVSAYEYLAVSRHSYTYGSIRHALADVGFEVDETALFSPLLPSVLGPLGLGALWLVAARRRDRNLSA